jgi:hypothetical protein
MIWFNKDTNGWDEDDEEAPMVQGDSDRKWKESSGV